MKIRSILISAAVLCLCGCAKETAVNYGELAERMFDVWVDANKESGWQQTGLGSWIKSMDKGDVAEQPVKTKDDYPYVRLDFTIRQLDGTVNSTSNANLAKQLGTYTKRTYYGPDMTSRATAAIYAGIEEVLDGMGVGGHCEIIVPGWLLTGKRFSSRQGYLDAMTETKSPLIYDFTVRERVADVEAWERAQIKEAMGEDWAKADSLADGVWYVQDKPSDRPDTSFTSGNSVYINYICRRIDGTGVDSNLADSMKVFNPEGKPGKTEAVLINWGDNATDLTMTTNKSSVVPGFAYGIYHMKPHEKGRVYMTSANAYGTSGSDTSIPAYCPIYFELEFTDEPEKD